MSTPEPVLPKSRQPVPVHDADAEEPDQRPARSVAEIEQAMTERTERLAQNVDELVTRMKPGRLARESVGRVSSKLTSPTGGPRPEVLGAVAGAVLVTVFVVWRATRRRRRS